MVAYLGRTQRGERMNFKVLAIAAALLGAFTLAGCSPQEQYVGLKASATGHGTKLTERDKKMMALAEADEWSIPLSSREVTDPTGEPPGTITIYNSSKKL